MRQEETKQSGQNKQYKPRHGEARQDKSRHDTTRQNKETQVRADEIRQDQIKRYMTKQDKAIRVQAKQSEAVHERINVGQQTTIANFNDGKHARGVQKRRGDQQLYDTRIRKHRTATFKRSAFYLVFCNMNSTKQSCSLMEATLQQR